MTKLTRQIAQAFLFAGAMLTTILVSRYLTLDPEVYFPKQVDTYKAHQTSLLLHVGGGMIAMFLGPFQFIQGLRKKHLTLHKILGRLYALGAVTSALAGLVMAPRAFGGFVTTSGLGFLAILSISTIVMAVTRARQHNITSHQQWVIRSFACTLAAFTLRGILVAHGILYESGIVSFPFIEMYQTVAWLCWVPNLIVAEWYINSLRKN